MSLTRAGAAAVLLACLGALPLGAQPRQEGEGIRVLPVRGSVYVVSGGGANIVVSVGQDGLLLVDSGSAARSEQVLATLEQLSRRVTASPRPSQSCVGGAPGCVWWASSELLPTIGGPSAPRPIVGIVNTSSDADHVGGNAVIGLAGRQFGVRNLGNRVTGAFVIAHENVALRLTKADQLELLPTESYFGDQKKLNFFNGEGVVIFHPPAAHSDGDSVVYFRGSDVLAVGDILDMTGYPKIDVEHGGTIQGIVDSMNWILDVAVVEHMMEGGTMVVPSHGRLVDAADVAYYRDMVTILRDRVAEMKRRGRSLAEIKAARLSRDYDGRFGKNPTWTPEMFVEAIYGTLGEKGTRAR